ncbi:MAG: dinuclear metal center YbgI/SA1388 family protein, partial [Arenicella sp.]
MKIKEVTHYLESLAPLSSQESYDNSGLIVGNKDTEITNTLISLDCTEAIIDEAISRGCNLIVSHHPIVFKGLKTFTGNNYVERTVIKAIKNDIAIYAIHTNLDNYKLGVNHKIGSLLGIKEPRILSPSKKTLIKLVTFVPFLHIEAVKEAIFKAGSGQVGNYSECSFVNDGTGTFKAGDSANPHLGSIGVRENAEEKRLEVLVSSHKISAVVSALKEAHPYEEVALDLIPIMNKNSDEGSGMIGELENEVTEVDFLRMLKDKFKCHTIRHTELINKPIKTIAWCGGAGSFLLGSAKSQKADIFITGDFKYHEFFDAENQLVIAD